MWYWGEKPMQWKQYTFKILTNQVIHESSWFKLVIIQQLSGRPRQRVKRQIEKQKKWDIQQPRGFLDMVRRMYLHKKNVN